MVTLVKIFEPSGPPPPYLRARSSATQTTLGRIEHRGYAAERSAANDGFSGLSSSASPSLTHDAVWQAEFEGLDRLGAGFGAEQVGATFERASASTTVRLGAVALSHARRQSQHPHASERHCGIQVVRNRALRPRPSPYASVRPSHGQQPYSPTAQSFAASETAGAPVYELQGTRQRGGTSPWLPATAAATAGFFMPAVSVQMPQDRLYMMHDLPVVELPPPYPGRRNAAYTLFQGAGGTARSGTPVIAGEGFGPVAAIRRAIVSVGKMVWLGCAAALCAALLGAATYVLMAAFAPQDRR